MMHNRKTTLGARLKQFYLVPQLCSDAVLVSPAATAVRVSVRGSQGMQYLGGGLPLNPWIHP